MRRTVAVVLALAVAAGVLLWAALRGRHSQTPYDVQVEELGSLSGPREDTTWSADGRHVVCVVCKGEQECVAVDGREGPLFDEISPSLEGAVAHDPPSQPRLGLTADASHVFYVGRRGDRRMVVVDGHETETVVIGSERDPGVALSPDGRRIAYRVITGERQQVVVDGQAGPPYRYVGGPTFSADGAQVAHTAWVASGKPPERIVVNGREAWKGEGQIEDLLASPGGKRLAWVAPGRLQPGAALSPEFVVLDGKAGQEYDQIGDMAFSPDGAHFAYEAKRGQYTELGTHYVVADARESPPYDHVSWLSYSPDGSHLAYAAGKASAAFVVLDGQAGPQYEGIHDLTFSPAGGRLAYVARKSGAGGPGGGPYCVVVDGREGREYEYVSELCFSPDGTRLAYIALAKGKVFAVVDGEAGRRYDDVHGLRFSPNSRRTGYAAMKYHGRYKGDRVVRRVCVVDGREGEAHHGTSAPAFSSDGRHVAYAASDATGGWRVIETHSDSGVRINYLPPRGHGPPSPGEEVEQWAVYVDGRPGPRFDEVGGPLTFQADGSLEYAAITGSTVYRVRHTPR